MLDSIFEPGVTGVSPFAIIISLYLAYYVHNDARNHNNPRAPCTGTRICADEISNRIVSRNFRKSISCNRAGRCLSR